MNFFYAVAAGAALAVVFFLSMLIGSYNMSEPETGQTEKKGKGGGGAEERRRWEAVRLCVFRAYKGMRDQRAHGLHFLTPIVERYGKECRADVARYALEQTRELHADRFDCSPINKALHDISEIENA